MAMASVESAGETFWSLDGKLVVPVRFEAHWFGKLTSYRFNGSHPDLSCVEWNAALAARDARRRVGTARRGPRPRSRCRRPGDELGRVSGHGLPLEAAGATKAFAPSSIA